MVFDFVLWSVFAGLLALVLHLVLERWVPGGVRRLPVAIREAMGVALVLILAGIVLVRYRPDGFQMFVTVALMFGAAGLIVSVAHLAGHAERQRQAGAEEVLTDVREWLSSLPEDTRRQGLRVLEGRRR